MPDETPQDRERESSPDRGIEEWKSQTKGIERVRSVVFTTDKPRPVSWFAEEALVSESTAREYLDLFADMGVVQTAGTKAKKYCIDQRYLRYLEVRELADEYSQDELVEMAEERQEQLESLKSEFGEESPTDIRTRVCEPDTPPEECARLRKVASEWETIQSQLYRIKEAVQWLDSEEKTSTESQPQAPA
jgi:hypothetical protein